MESEVKKRRTKKRINRKHYKGKITLIQIISLIGLIIIFLSQNAISTEINEVNGSQNYINDSLENSENYTINPTNNSQYKLINLSELKINESEDNILKNKLIYLDKDLNLKKKTKIICQNTTFISNQKNKIIIDKKKKVEIIGCLFKNFSQTLLINKSFEIKIQNNQFIDSRDGIILEDTHYCKILNNTFKNKRYGIFHKGINGGTTILKNRFYHSHLFLSTGVYTLFAENQNNEFYNNSIGPTKNCTYITPVDFTFKYNYSKERIDFCPGNYVHTEGILIRENPLNPHFTNLTIVGHNTTFYGLDSWPGITLIGTKNVSIHNITFRNYIRPVHTNRICKRDKEGKAICLEPINNTLKNVRFYNMKLGFRVTPSKGGLTIENSEIIIPENNKNYIDSYIWTYFKNNWYGTNDNKIFINRFLKPINKVFLKYFTFRNFPGNYNTKLNLIKIKNHTITLKIRYDGKRRIASPKLEVTYLDENGIISQYTIKTGELDANETKNITIRLATYLPYKRLRFRLISPLNENLSDNTIDLNIKELSKLNNQTNINNSELYKISNITLICDNYNYKELFSIYKEEFENLTKKPEKIVIIKLPKQTLLKKIEEKFENKRIRIEKKNNTIKIFANDKLSLLTALQEIIEYYKTKNNTNKKIINGIIPRIDSLKTDYLKIQIKKKLKKIKNINLSNIYKLKKKFEKNQIREENNKIETEILNKKIQLRIKKIAPKERIFNRTLIFVGGLWSNLTSWKKTAKKFARLGFKTYLIEITGNPELENGTNYEYEDLYKNILPRYLKKIIADKKKDEKIIYIGHSNGARTYLSYALENNGIINKIPNAILVGTPFTFTEKTPISKELIKNRYILQNLKNNNITNPSLYNILEKLNNTIKWTKTLFKNEQKKRISYNLFQRYIKLMDNNINQTTIKKDNLKNNKRKIYLESALIIGGKYYGTNSDLVVPLSDEYLIYDLINSTEKKIKILNTKHTGMTNDKQIYKTILEYLIET